MKKILSIILIITLTFSFKAENNISAIFKDSKNIFESYDRNKILIFNPYLNDVFNQIHTNFNLIEDFYNNIQEDLIKFNQLDINQASDQNNINQIVNKINTLLQLESFKNLSLNLSNYINGGIKLVDGKDLQEFIHTLYHYINFEYSDSNSVNYNLGRSSYTYLLSRINQSIQKSTLNDRLTALLNLYQEIKTQYPKYSLYIRATIDWEIHQQEDFFSKEDLENQINYHQFFPKIQK